VAEQGTAKIVPFERRADVVAPAHVETVVLPPLIVPPPRKPGWPTLAALAIACGIAAVVLGSWAVFTEARSRTEPAVRTEQTPIVEPWLDVLTDGSARHYPLRNSVGRIALVADDADRAVLTLDGLGPAPEGSTYQVWFVPPGSAQPYAAGTFDGTERVVPLPRAVRRGTRVGLTLERAPGAVKPSRTLRLVALRD
jgi:Anti-sigma-K factor rskA